MLAKDLPLKKPYRTHSNFVHEKMFWPRWIVRYFSTYTWRAPPPPRVFVQTTACVALFPPSRAPKSRSRSTKAEVILTSVTTFWGVRSMSIPAASITSTCFFLACCFVPRNEWDAHVMFQYTNQTEMNTVHLTSDIIENDRFTCKYCHHLSRFVVQVIIQFVYSGLTKCWQNLPTCFQLLGVSISSKFSVMNVFLLYLVFDNAVKTRIYSFSETHLKKIGKAKTYITSTTKLP